MDDWVPANEPFSMTKTLYLSTQDNLGADETVNETQPSLHKDESILFGEDVDKGLNCLQKGSDGTARGDGLIHDAEHKEVDSYRLQGASKKGVEMNGNHGLEEILQLAQEFEWEVAKKNVEEEATENLEDPLEEKLLQENGALHADEHPIPIEKESEPRFGQKIDSLSQKSEVELTKKNGTATYKAPKPRLSAASATLLKGASKIVGRKKTAGDEVEEGAETVTSQNNATQRSINIGPSRSNFTIPQPFALATDKRASLGGRQLDEPVGMANKPRLSGPVGNVCHQNPQVPKSMGSKLFAVKSLHSWSMKHCEDYLVNLSNPLDTKIDDDDVQSISSVQSASRTLKTKSSTLISTHSFSFKSDERAVKRKEFYSKLEEKQHAKEEEKHLMQARTKEEMEAEIRKLRKSLTFKATPMPSFYQEGCPPKMEQKKIPQTGTKPPKTGRQSMCAGLESEEISIQFRGSIHSGEKEHGSSDTVQKPTDKNGDKVSKKPVRKSLSKLPTEKVSKSKHLSSANIPESDPASTADLYSTPVNVSVDNIKLRLGNELSISSVHCSDEKIGPLCERDGISENKTNRILEGGSDHLVLTNESSNSNAGVVLGSSDICVEGNRGTDSSLTKRIPQKGMLNKAKSVLSEDFNARKCRISKQIGSDETKELNAKASKSMKCERLKASTPSIRKSTANGSMKHTTKSDHDTTLVVADVAVHS